MRRAGGLIAPDVCAYGGATTVLLLANSSIDDYAFMPPESLEGSVFWIRSFAPAKLANLASEKLPDCPTLGSGH